MAHLTGLHVQHSPAHADNLKRFSARDERRSSVAQIQFEISTNMPKKPDLTPDKGFGMPKIHSCVSSHWSPLSYTFEDAIHVGDSMSRKIHLLFATDCRVGRLRDLGKQWPITSSPSI